MDYVEVLGFLAVPDSRHVRRRHRARLKVNEVEDRRGEVRVVAQALDPVRRVHGQPQRGRGVQQRRDQRLEGLAGEMSLGEVFPRVSLVAAANVLADLVRC